jgi:hypothetical protein
MYERFCNNIARIKNKLYQFVTRAKSIYFTFFLPRDQGIISMAKRPFDFFVSMIA